MLDVDDLVLQAKRGERGALEALLVRCQRPLLSFVYRMVGRDRALAEDLTQDVFLRVVGNLDRFEPERLPKLADGEQESARATRAFEKWLYTIARNRIRDHWRASRPQVSLDDDAAEPAAPAVEPWRAIEEEARGKEVEKAIDRLPFAQREVLTLRLHAGLTFAEISEVMGAPLGTSLARMRYALANLKRLLEHEA